MPSDDILKSVADDTFERMRRAPDYLDEPSPLLAEWEKIIHERPHLRGFIERLAHDYAPGPEKAAERSRIASALITLTLALDESQLIHNHETEFKIAEPSAEID